MVKIYKADLDPKTFSHTLKGFYLKTWNGRTVVARSPRFGPRNNRNSVWWRNQFTIAARMAASPLWLDYQAALGLSRGTEQVPRDILMMAAYGNLFSVELPDGTVTTVADHGPPPPQPIPEENLMQAWSSYDNPWSNTYSSFPKAFKGVIFTATANMEINGMNAIAGWIAGGTYRMLIAKLTGANVIDSIAVVSNKTISLTAHNNIYFAGTGTLEAGSKYFIAIGRTDLTGSYDMPVNNEKVAQWTAPVSRGTDANIASTNPTVGDALSTYGSLQTPPFGFNYKVV